MKKYRSIYNYVQYLQYLPQGPQAVCTDRVLLLQPAEGVLYIHKVLE
jgi:hypothetical protein